MPNGRTKTTQSIEEFFAKLEKAAKDWRYSDEFLGILVRAKWPREYDVTSSSPSDDQTSKRLSPQEASRMEEIFYISGKQHRRRS